eukprot:scaffold2971_cov274-Pinguiococcus_pyrenoidosus.AAC.3
MMNMLSTLLNNRLQLHEDDPEKSSRKCQLFEAGRTSDKGASNMKLRNTAFNLQHYRERRAAQGVYQRRLHAMHEHARDAVAATQGLCSIELITSPAITTENRMNVHRYAMVFTRTENDRLPATSAMNVEIAHRVAYGLLEAGKAHEIRRQNAEELAEAANAQRLHSAEGAIERRREAVQAAVQGFLHSTAHPLSRARSAGEATGSTAQNEESSSSPNEELVGESEDHSDQHLSTAAILEAPSATSTFATVEDEAPRKRKRRTPLGTLQDPNSASVVNVQRIQELLAIPERRQFAQR